MFRSRRRPVVFSQADHARFSAAIAAVWGNEQFEPPPLDLVSFVRGVALHDRGYDSIGDTHSTQPGAGRSGRWAGTGKVECGIHTVKAADVEEILS